VVTVDREVKENAYRRTGKYSNICIRIFGETGSSNMGLHTQKISQAREYLEVLGMRFNSACAQQGHHHVFPLSAINTNYNGSSFTSAPAK
jgi:hypothetical protein